MDQTQFESIKCGMFNNKSYWGEKSSVLKSGICKYYRRGGIWDKFEWCIIEMALFGLKQTGKALVTNLINRLKILVMEEISFVNIADISQAIQILEGLGGLDTNKKMAELLKFIGIVKELKRVRIVSYTNYWWSTKKREYEFENVKLDKVLKFKKKNDTNELLKYGELFIQFVDSKDENMFGILKLFMEWKASLVVDIEGKMRFI